MPCVECDGFGGGHTANCPLVTGVRRDEAMSDGIRDGLFDLEEIRRTEAAHPGRFRDRVREELLRLGCTHVVRASEGTTMLRVVEPDGRRAVYVTLSRSEKNDKDYLGWTLNQESRYKHRLLEAAGEPVMYALQDGDEIRVVPGDYLIIDVTLAEGTGGRSEHLLIRQDGRWPTLAAYLTRRG